MNRQEVFNKVARALKKQGSQARGPVSGWSAYGFVPGAYGCVYLTQDGRRCAVGHLIPDGHPGLQVEGSLNGLLDLYPDLREILEIEDEEDDLAFLSSLQEAHDDSSGTFLEEWVPRMRGIAERYNLNAEVLS